MPSDEPRTSQVRAPRRSRRLLAFMVLGLVDGAYADTNKDFLQREVGGQRGTRWRVDQTARNYQALVECI